MRRYHSRAGATGGHQVVIYVSTKGSYRVNEPRDTENCSAS
ncbi:MAG TPA: hypothetical protein VLK27_02325 [Chthoniobacterales bacterium]|nr:hypothetical protein [Chthoniobacterales bacterium]